MTTSKIYINIENQSTIESILDTLNGRVKRDIGFLDLTSAIRNAEASMETLAVSKRARVGAQIRVNPARNRQPEANSYSYHANATEVRLVKNTVGWYLDETQSGVRGALSSYRERDEITILPASAFDRTKMLRKTGVELTD